MVVKSSEDIPPQIGMQVNHYGEIKKIVSINNDAKPYLIEFIDQYNLRSILRDKGYWNMGHYEITVEHQPRKTRLELILEEINNEP